MDSAVFKIAMAGLLHDIGKFAQGSLEVAPAYWNGNANLYLPFNKKEGRYTHQHALFTAAFIEQMKDLLPDEFNQPGWGKGDSFINLAAGHHKPESPMQWIITKADWISSGLDRDEFEPGENIAFTEAKKTRLLPLFEQISPENKKVFSKRGDFKWRYELAPLSARSIFPVKNRDIKKKDAEQEYRQLFHDFCDSLGQLYHRKENVELWSLHFDSLLKTYTSHIPAARTGMVVHDVSLYDHCRTTAALAASLYLYHSSKDDLNKSSILDGHAEKLLLVSGDFYGIQDFIFSAGGEMRHHRSKILRGRSFAVSLFTELAADMLCREIGLPFLAVIMNAAGKFHLIAPNTQDAMRAINSTETQINDWLFDISCGQSTMGITATPAATDEFTGSSFKALWQKHMSNMESRKCSRLDLNRYGGVVSGYLDRFNNELNSRLCPLCGKRPSSKEAENDKIIYRDTKGSACKICRDHVMLGTHLVKNKMLAVLDASSAPTNRTRLLCPIFDKYQVIFTDNPLEKEAAEKRLFKLWSINIDKDGTIPTGASAMLLNGYVPLYGPEDEHDDRLLSGKRSQEKTEEMIDLIKDKTPKTFAHIAAKALFVEVRDDDSTELKGTEAIGVFKADIDNLGAIFGCGLADNRFTISRIATLSRQLNTFFTVHLPHFLSTETAFQDVYTVFAGGDDLFLIGPWNRMAELALHLQDQFHNYVCKNDDIHFSAGITVHKPNTPIDRIAEESEHALETSKGAGRNRITMFGVTVPWSDFQELFKKKAVLQTWLAKGYLAQGMFYRFNDFVRMAGEKKLIKNEEAVHIHDLECLKWPSMFCYSVYRNINSSFKNEDREKVYKELSEMAVWIELYGEGVKIPLWHLLYDIR